MFSVLFFVYLFFFEIFSGLLVGIKMSKYIVGVLGIFLWRITIFACRIWKLKGASKNSSGKKKDGVLTKIIKKVAGSMVFIFE